MKNPGLSGAATFLVIGGDGLIGEALVRFLRSETSDVYATSRRRAVRDPHLFTLDLESVTDDLFSDGRIQKIAARGRLITFITAAITKIADCEQHPERSQLVNVTRTVELGKLLLNAGSGVVFLSSNAIFSGRQPFPTEFSLPDPTTNYGRQKAEAEQALRSFHSTLPAAPPLMIVRLTKVVARTAPLIEGWIENLRAGSQISAFADRYFSPISIGFTVESLVKIAKNWSSGIYHVSGARDLTYYEFARMLASSIGVAPSLVNPVVPDVSIVGLTQQYSALGGTASNALVSVGAEEPEAVAQSLVI